MPEIFRGGIGNDPSFERSNETISRRVWLKICKGIDQVQAFELPLSTIEDGGSQIRQFNPLRSIYFLWFSHDLSDDHLIGNRPMAHKDQEDQSPDHRLKKRFQISAFRTQFYAKHILWSFMRSTATPSFIHRGKIPYLEP